MHTPYSWKSYFVVLSDYQQWANDRLFAALGSLDPAQLSSPQGLFFGSIHHTTDHIMQVGRLWCARLRGEPYQADFKRILYPDWNQLIEMTQSQSAELSLLLEARDEAFFDERLAFTSSNGQAREMWVRDVLTHMMNHQTHHRGQISAVITRLGGTAPEMDYFYYKIEMDGYLQTVRADQSLSSGSTNPSSLA
ncbi:MAG: DinB family protein [Pseudomonadota bacterium]